MVRYYRLNTVTVTLASVTPADRTTTVAGSTPRPVISARPVAFKGTVSVFDRPEKGDTWALAMTTCLVVVPRLMCAASALIAVTFFPARCSVTVAAIVTLAQPTAGERQTR